MSDLHNARVEAAAKAMWDFDLNYRVPADLKPEFIETLHHYDMTEH